MNLYASITLAHVSGQVEDEVLTSFALTFDGVPTSANLEDLSTAMVGFYTANLGGNSSGLSANLGGQLSRAANDGTVRLYEVPPDLNLADEDLPNMGSPIAVESFTIAAMDANAKSLPAEVALCISRHADLTGFLEQADNNTRPRARRRGRVFIGPLATMWLGTGNGVAGEQRPAPALMDYLLNVAVGWHNSCEAINFHPAIWSRKNGAFAAITGYSVDNSFDTVRSRGAAPTDRVALDVGP